jgi:hypothetical protein
MRVCLCSSSIVVVVVCAKLSSIRVVDAARIGGSVAVHVYSVCSSVRTRIEYYCSCSSS